MKKEGHNKIKNHALVLQQRYDLETSNQSLALLETGWVEELSAFGAFLGKLSFRREATHSNGARMSCVTSAKFDSIQRHYNGILCLSSCLKRPRQHQLRTEISAASEVPSRQACLTIDNRGMGLLA
ncbi:hypothetical protein O181_029339 [Austropuccinia psidii MF-1]|uniref:Uncharacterized protein n=1 Tax=Austropuccinia psidii MF-1 TaxID=1389203 RepID=A0A9Q3H4G7_9BASI|nr:hypothetical protein [Austropuccinia psidii MF-1]